MEEPGISLSFENRNQALPLLHLLDERGIPYEVGYQEGEWTGTYREVINSPVSVQIAMTYLDSANALLRKHFPGLMESDEDIMAEVPAFPGEEKKPPVEPEELDHVLIAMYYILGAIGGLPGIFIGLGLIKSIAFKEDGTEKPAYGPATRKHGSNLVIFGLLAAFFWGWLLYKRFGTS
jgi:hypothetical protein